MWMNYESFAVNISFVIVTGNLLSVVVYRIAPYLFIVHRISDLILAYGFITGSSMPVILGILLRIFFIAPTEIKKIFLHSPILVRLFYPLLIGVGPIFVFRSEVLTRSFAGGAAVVLALGFLAPNLITILERIAESLGIFSQRYFWPIFCEGLFLKIPAFATAGIRLMLRFAHNGNAQRAVTTMLVGALLFFAYYVEGPR